MRHSTVASCAHRRRVCDTGWSCCLQVIKGWTEAMQLMVVGDKWEMYIPMEMAYGPSGKPPKIPGGATLIFIMESETSGIRTRAPATS